MSPIPAKVGVMHAIRAVVEERLGWGVERREVIGEVGGEDLRGRGGRLG
jgi:hypothetical protein